MIYAFILLLIYPLQVSSNSQQTCSDVASLLWVFLDESVPPYLTQAVLKSVGKKQN
jgi:hypothetical protein